MRTDQVRQQSWIDPFLWTATGLCATVTLWLSVWSVPPGTSAFGGADKVEHAVAYFVTTMLFLLAAVWRPGRGDGVLAPWKWWVLVGVALAGGALEFVQSRVGRKAEFTDWAAELIAVVAAAGVLRWLQLRGGQ